MLRAVPGWRDVAQVGDAQSAAAKHMSSSVAFADDVFILLQLSRYLVRSCLGQGVRVCQVNVRRICTAENPQLKSWCSEKDSAHS